MRRRLVPGDSARGSIAAKINISLQVVGRRDNGYHELSMLNCQIDLFDELRLQITENAGVSVQTEVLAPCNNRKHPIPSDPEGNLASRAAIQFCRAFGLSAGIQIQVQKRIPTRAGLGGGSADAAWVLCALREMFCQRSEWSSEGDSSLAELALSLGADVPYFLTGGLCRVQGIGERVTGPSMAPIHQAPLMLFFPNVALTTQEVFRAYADEGEGEWASAQKEELSLESVSLEEAALCRNDLQKAACSLAPELLEAIAVLGRVEGACVRMSGSGSTLCVYPTKPGLDEIQFFEAIEGVGVGVPGCFYRTRLLANSQNFCILEPS